MNSNLACSVVGCTNPVIGQCTGYQKTCARYYCNNHSIDTLCADCSSQKEEDEHEIFVYNEYLALAEGVLREPIPKFEFKGTKLLIAGLISFFLGLALLCVLFIITVLTKNIINPSYRELVNIFFLLSGFTAIGFMGLPFLVIPGVYIFQLDGWTRKEENKKIIKRVNEIGRTKPGFVQFWNTWLELRNKKQAENAGKLLLGVLAVAGVFAVSAVSVFVDSESKTNQNHRHY